MIAAMFVNPDPIYNVDDDKALDDLEALLTLMADHVPQYAEPDVNRLARHARRFLEALKNVRVARK